MSEPQRHYIGRPVFEIALRRTADAARLREKAAAAWEDAILPELDRVFSELAPTARFYRFARIEIDLGEIGEADLDGPIAQKIARMLRQQLSERRAESAAESDPRAVVLSRDELDLELLQVFLATGVLPGWAGEDEHEDLETTLAALLERGAPMRAFLHDVIAGSIQRQRLIAQFSDAVLWKVLRALGFLGDVQDAAQRAEAAASAAAQVGVPREAWRARFWDSLLSLAVQSPVERDPTAGGEADREHVRSALKSAASSNLREAAEPAGEATAKGTAGAPSKATVSATAKVHARATVEAPGEATPEAAPQATIREPAQEVREAVQSGICVKNAGLVLLWPYLERFFGSLGLLENGQFSSEAAAARAIHLLQYLADARAGAPEHALPLNKLLCGWDFWRPIPRCVELTDNETAEARLLLETAVAHWPALKKTSVDGLRRAFLQRNGLITRDGAEWLLRVERQTHDVLLERLPWPLSPILLPWTERIILVEW